MVKQMKKNTIYHIFLFLSTFSRGLVEVFSLVLLYKKGFSVSEIFLFLFLLYTIGILVNYISLKLSYKLVLFSSSLLYGISFLFLSFMNNYIYSLVILAFLLAFSTYSYHVIRHLLALELLERKDGTTGHIVVVTYLGVILASLIGVYLIEKLSFGITSIIIFVLSVLAIMPVLKLGNLIRKKLDFKNGKVIISKDKLWFNVLEQFKVIFLEIQPLFLFIYIEKSIYYVGIFNVIVNIASLVVVYFLSSKIRLKYFKYICFLLGIVFLLKLNVKSEIFLLGLAFFEGIFVKLYESVSLNNLYDLKGSTTLEYLLVEEFIFFLSKSLIMLVFCCLSFSIEIVLYISIIGIVWSGFYIRENT